MMATEPINRQVLLKSRPSGIPQAEHFEIGQGAIETPSAGQILVRNIFWSVEPAMRGWVSDVANYSEPVAIGSVMRAFSAGIVMASEHADFQPGDYVSGLFGWQDYACVDAQSVVSRPTVSERVPLATSLGVLGLNGLTAYFGLLEVGQPKSGETVVVSTAAGAVGSCVGQIARKQGCHTIGITGGAQKVDICLNEFGYNKAVDYKAASFEQDFISACADGVDVYFDNTAGNVSDVVMTKLNPGARVIVCGTASISQWDPVPVGPRVNRQLLVARARMQGILVLDYADRYDEARNELARWVADGDIRYREDVTRGVEAAPDAIAGLYRGENLGKRLIQVAELDGTAVTGG